MQGPCCPQGCPHQTVDVNGRQKTSKDKLFAVKAVFSVVLWTSLDFGGFENGGQRRDRTADAGLFRAALYH
jgi:hypothetical protein